MGTTVSGSEIRLTNSAQDYADTKHVDEMLLCLDDPLYFMSNFMKVQHPTDGLLAFKPHDYQIELINAFHQNRFVIACCARQLGKTTCAAGYLLWRAMFVPDSVILVTANKYVQALEIMQKVKLIWEHCPIHIRANVIDNNKGTMSFDNGSRIVSRATSPDAGRGLAISLLYMDEFAIINPRLQSEVFTSLSPTLSQGGSCIITSTPKSDQDQFASIFREAQDNKDEYGNPNTSGLGTNGYKAVEISWRRHPTLDEKWAFPFRQSLGPKRFAQEFENSFLSDENTVVDSAVLGRLKAKQPLYFTNNVRWFSEIDPAKNYIVCLDPALGMAYDYSAIQVFAVSRNGHTQDGMVQVAEWQNNTTNPRDQVRVLMQTLLFIQSELDNYEGAVGEIFWSFENNTIGETILQIVEHSGEERFCGTLVNERRKRGQTSSGRRFRKGLNTNPLNKRNACARMKNLIESDRLKISSEVLIGQLKNFGPSAKGGFAAKIGHDDLVSAMLIAIRTLDVILHWDAAPDNLKEYIGDDDLNREDELEPMPYAL